MLPGHVMHERKVCPPPLVQVAYAAFLVVTVSPISTVAKMITLLFKKDFWGLTNYGKVKGSAGLV